MGQHHIEYRQVVEGKRALRVEGVACIDLLRCRIHAAATPWTAASEPCGLIGPG